MRIIKFKHEGSDYWVNPVQITFVAVMRCLVEIQFGEDRYLTVRFVEDARAQEFAKWLSEEIHAA